MASWCKLLFNALDGFSTKTVLGVIVDDSDGLHPRIHDDRADKLKTAKL